MAGYKLYYALILDIVADESEQAPKRWEESCWEES
jgi:hypothetical protein